MLLNKVLVGLKNYLVYGKKDVFAKKLCINSKKCTKNSIFFCISGTKVDGKQYIDEAILNGAIAIVMQKKDEKIYCKNKKFDNITFVFVDDVREAMAVMSANFFGNPQKKLKMIGITGTNGKTSTSYIIAQMLKNYGKKVGIIGTSGNFFDDEKHSAKLTTPDSIDLFEILNKMVQKNIEYCVMEVSAHAIFLKKIFGVDFAVKVLTNVKTDHLDFFKTQNNYENAKLSFFERGENFVVNGDDKVGKIISKSSKDKTVTFGYQKSNYYKICDENLTLSGSEFDIKTKKNKYHFYINLVGKFNIYNFACAVAVLEKLGFFVKKLPKKCQKFDILGRFSIFYHKNNVNIIIDYAHTVDSLKNLFETISSVSKNKNIVVFGAPGERESQKRKLFGQLAVKYCETVIVTTDNPASENPRRIAFEILSGTKNSSKNCFYIEDRKKAIKKAFDMAKRDTNILIVGKGSEDCQIVGDKKIPYCDFDEVKKYLDYKN